VIAIDMPNDNDAVGEEWAKFRTSPAAIERRTGFKFFDRLRPDVAEALRQKVDNAPIAPPRPVSQHRD
jgi:DNA/RNA endonuclease G (NUC1)